MSLDRSIIELWGSCLSIIKDNVGAESYKTWFSPIRPINFENNELLLEIPSHFFYEMLEDKYSMLIRKTVDRVFGVGVQLNYTVSVVKSEGKDTTVRISADNSVSKQSIDGKVTDASLQAKKHTVATQDLDPQLNPNYSFDNFIEGNTNKLSRSVAMSVATDTNSSAFNPLFIHGPSGVGKTHLINAIGAKTKELYPQKRVIYLSAHLFQVQFTDSTKHNTSNDFINFYRSIDVLIIDDIQEFEGKEKTLNAFFHIFNYLRDSGKRIIITSDRHPSNLKNIEERLITRFKWGMVAELEKPDVELRRNILKNKLRRDGIALPDDVIEYLAENVSESVRELEGAVLSLLAHSTVFNKDITLALAKSIISGSKKSFKKNITIDTIVETVCRHWQIDTEEIQKKSRKKEVVIARQTAMYLANKYTEASTTAIGRIIGGKNHATVIYSCKAIRSQQEVDKKFREELKQIEDLITN